MATEESWRDVVGYEDRYSVSNFGRVFAKEITTTQMWRGKIRTLVWKAKLLQGWSNRKGYHLVGLYDGRSKRARQFPVHQLVLTAFVGTRPVGMEGCHKDGNPANNHLSNLEWNTHQKNMDDRDRHGRHDRGEDSVVAKLTEADVRRIRKRLEETTTYWGRLSHIGKEFGVGAATIRDIEKRYTWKHLD